MGAGLQKITTYNPWQRKTIIFLFGNFEFHHPLMTFQPAGCSIYHRDQGTWRGSVSSEHYPSLRMRLSSLSCQRFDSTASVVTRKQSATPHMSRAIARCISSCYSWSTYFTIETIGQRLGMSDAWWCYGWSCPIWVTTKYVRDAVMACNGCWWAIPVLVEWSITTVQDITNGNWSPTITTTNDEIVSLSGQDLTHPCAELASSGWIPPKCHGWAAKWIAFQGCSSRKWWFPHQLKVIQHPVLIGAYCHWNQHFKNKCS